MLFPLISARIHGWLDEAVPVANLAFIWLLGLEGPARWFLLSQAGVHFLNVRLTRYPRGTWPLYSLRVHLFIELLEGLALITASVVLPLPPVQRGVLAFGGATQLGAFALGSPVPAAAI